MPKSKGLALGEAMNSVALVTGRTCFTKENILLVSKASTVDLMLTADGSNYPRNCSTAQFTTQKARRMLLDDC